MFKTLNKGLALVDLDDTVREAIRGEFVNQPYNQRIIPNVGNVLKELNNKGFAVYAVSNQGGIKAGYKTLKSTLVEMRHTLSLCKHIQRIYFSYDEQTVWVMTRTLPILDKLPLIINTFSRYVITTSVLGDPKYLLGGYRKPSPGMLKLAIADWYNKYEKEGLIDGYSLVEDPKLYEHYKIFMTGDRPEDEGAAAKAKVPFVSAELFQQGEIPY